MTDRRFGSLMMEDSGAGPESSVAIVMLHGLGGTSNTFDTLVGGLDGYRVLRPDLPGAGRSPLRPGLKTIGDLAGAITDALKAAAVSRAILVGHSMGTLLAQHMAVTAPRRVSGLILFGALSEPPEAARQGLLERAETAQRHGMAGIADTVADTSLSAQSRAGNPVAHAFVRESLMRQPPAGYAAHCRALARAQAFAPMKIHPPVRLITGADDPVAPPAMAEALNRALPRSKLDILPGVGHWPMLEAPQKSCRILGKALAEMTSATTPERT